MDADEATGKSARAATEASCETEKAATRKSRKSCDRTIEWNSAIARPPRLQEYELIPGQENTKRTAPTALLVTPEQWQQVIDHLRAALPAEGCGLLACAEGDHGDLTIRHIFPGTNALKSPTRYRMAATEVIYAFRAMREQGLRLAAIFHSHPMTPPTLSDTDLREANYPDAAILIVSFAAPLPEAAAWRLEPREDQWAAAKIPIHIRSA